MPSLAFIIALSWALGALMHWWPCLPPGWRRITSIATSAAGLAFIVAATSAEGTRETAIAAAIVLGPAYVSATTAAASLAYYQLAGVCLLLGFTGLALGEKLARWLREHYVLSAVLVAWLVTIMRFLLERSAAPRLLTEAVGVTWMAPVAGAWLAYCLRDGERLWRRLLSPLVAYAFLVRGFVAAVSVVATRLQLGTHYDVSPVVRMTVLGGATYSFESGGYAQVFVLALLPQLVVWPVFTVLAGLAAGSLFWRWLPQRTRRRVAALAAEAVPSKERG